MNSIRQYLWTRLLWGSTGILVVGAVVLGLAVRTLDLLEFDSALETKARTLATLVLREGRAIEVDFAGEYMPEFEAAEDAQYFQFRFTDGSVIERSDTLGENDLPFLPVDPSGAVSQNLRLPDGRRGRFVQVTLSPRAGAHVEIEDLLSRSQIAASLTPAEALVVLSVARSREPLDALLLKVYFCLACMVLLILGLLALLLYRSLDRCLQPIVEMNAQIRNIGSDSLDKRIEIAISSAELDPVLCTLNRLLEDLQSAFTRERHFTSNIAHELRTPVAEFRAACEVGARWSDDPALVRERFENLRESACNMERMVKSLLDLSRVDSRAVVAEVSETCISELIDTCWAQEYDADEQLAIQMNNCIDPSVVINTHAAGLEMIASNLLQNAAAYRTPNTAVTCAWAPSHDGDWMLSISNHAQDLAREDLEHVFERFWRKDTARTGGSHVGLGLSLVQSLADMLGLGVTVDLSDEGVFTVSLIFPKSMCA